ncbi:50S ribosome-binding GTPase [Metallumcola ferriviriculae]|uniref:50S ribosome-binding GTPase n=1 Tax=Metallumcola ferriviriculae TaxID=3039180 RepID=A0AAU0UQA2_9FIRM|nr:50S ribosome-binding GTPase [Desulfitibacteraceae bacterium MK1]
MTAKKILLAGRTNVGKSLLALTLTRFLGINTLPITWHNYPNKNQTYRFNFAIAKQKLVNAAEYHTQGLYDINIELSKLTKLQLVDTTALTDEVHPKKQLRQYMAMTIEAIQDCDCLIHIYDAEYYTDHPIADIDRSLMELETKGKYISVVNKIDTLKANVGVQRIQSLAGENSFLCSCTTGQGIVALRQELLKLLKV